MAASENSQGNCRSRPTSIPVCISHALLTFELSQHPPFDSVADEARRQWLIFHARPADSDMALARRAGMSYRQLRHFLSKLQIDSHDLLNSKAHPQVEQEIVYVPSDEHCQFCDSTDDIHLHHVVSRHESPITVALCSKCHRKFHFLNKLYRPPVRRSK